MSGSPRARILAWTLGLGGVAACGAGAYVVIALGAPRTFLVAYLVGVVMAVIGALIASREPGNRIGWLLCVVSIAVSVTHLPAGYGYFALVTEHGSWPLGPAAMWLSAWGYAPIFGMFLPVISVRFPDGKVLPGWRYVDLLATAGTVLFAAGIVFRPWNVLLNFVALPSPRLEQVAPNLQQGQAILNPVQALGLVLIVLAYVASAASIGVRYRRAGGDVRAQLRWFVYAGILITISVAYGAVAYGLLGVPLYLALTPFVFTVLALPLAIAVAILRYRLYDIDLIINRTLVYGSLTAIVAALYAAVVAIGNRLFISASGQKSDAAYFAVAFVVVVAAYPLKDWLQRQVDRRVAHRSPSAVLGEFSADVEAVVSILDVRRVACRLVDEAVSAFSARGAALYLDGSLDSPAYSQGRADGAGTLEVDLRHEGRQLGRLVLGSRRGDLAYTRADREALQRSADLVGEALALAVRRGNSALIISGGTGAKEGHTHHRSRRHPDQQAVDD